MRVIFCRRFWSLDYAGATLRAWLSFFDSKFVAKHFLNLHLRDKWISIKFSAIQTLGTRWNLKFSKLVKTKILTWNPKLLTGFAKFLQCFLLIGSISASLVVVDLVLPYLVLPNAFHAVGQLVVWLFYSSSCLFCRDLLSQPTCRYKIS